jgi:hypothetical protein
VKSLVFEARSALIKERAARETPCVEVREEIATAHGLALRKGLIRRHVRQCKGCAEFEMDVRKQRQMLAIVLPVIPSFGLKESALAAAGIGGGAAGGGGLIAAVGGAGAGKILAGIAVGGAIGGVAATNPGLVERAGVEITRAANVVRAAWTSPSDADARREASREFDEGLRRDAEEARRGAEDAAGQSRDEEREDSNSRDAAVAENGRDKGSDQGTSGSSRDRDEASGGGRDGRGGDKDQDRSSGSSGGGGGGGDAGGSGGGGLRAPSPDLDGSSPVKVPKAPRLPVP